MGKQPRLVKCSAGGKNPLVFRGRAVIVWFPIRGGNWSNGAIAGLAALNLNNRRSNVNNNVGLRPALPLSQMPCAYGRAVSIEGKRSPTPSLPEGRENINRRGRLVGASEYRPRRLNKKGE